MTRHIPDEMSQPEPILPDGRGFGSTFWVTIVAIMVCITGVFACGGLFALFRYQKSREAVAREQVEKNLKELGLKIRKNVEPEGDQSLESTDGDEARVE